MNSGERRNDLAFFLFLTEETFIKNPLVPVGSHLLLPSCSVLQVHFPRLSLEKRSLRLREASAPTFMCSWTEHICWLDPHTYPMESMLWSWRRNWKDTPKLTELLGSREDPRSSDSWSTLLFGLWFNNTTTCVWQKGRKYKVTRVSFYTWILHLKFN